MKKLYLNKLKTLCIVAVLILSGSSMNAQETIKWLGGVSSDAFTPDNWDPQTTPNDNILAIPPDTAYTYVCTINGTDDITIPELAFETLPVASTANPGELTINMDQGKWFNFANPAIHYSHGIVNITGGNFRQTNNRDYRLEDSLAQLHINCDTVILRNFFALGDRNGTSGGYVTITGNSFVQADEIIRVPTLYEDAEMTIPKVSLFISDNAELRLTRSDYTTYMQSLIESGHFTTDWDNYDLITYWDSEARVTVVKPRNAFLFAIEPINPQTLVAGEEGDSIYAVNNRGLANKTDLEWVYGTTDGTFDRSTGVTGQNWIKPNFSESGTFYLALKGTEDGNTTYTNSIKFIVGSSVLTVSPDVEQLLRVGQEAAMLTASSSGEWKYSTTSGGPYTSFEPALNGTEFSANFTEPGVYYVVCEGDVNGSTEVSKEVVFEITSWNDAARVLTYIGDTDSDGDNILNWSPAAYIHKNSIEIPENVTVEVQNVVRDTLYGISSGAGALFTLNADPTDTLELRANYDTGGSLAVHGGVFVYDRGYIRFTAPERTFTLTNDAKAIIKGVEMLLGNSSSPTTGGNLFIQDDAVMLFNVSNSWGSMGFGRVCNTVGNSELHLRDNAQYRFVGDHRSSLIKFIDGETDAEGNYTTNPKFLAPEGFEVKMIYDVNANQTVVYAEDVTSFRIGNAEEQTIAANQPSEPLTLEMADFYNSFEWVWSVDREGPYESFSPAVTGETASVSFGTAGTYFVKCLADGTDLTTNFAMITISPIAITPADDQLLATDEMGTELTASYADGYTLVEWMYREKGSDVYKSFTELYPGTSPESGDTYTPYGESIGTHFIVCSFRNPDGATVYTNEVAIWVDEDPTGISPKEKVGVKMYPNPSDGNFFIEVDTNEPATIEVINTAGALVSKKQITGAGTVPVSVNTKGLYLVKVTAGKAVKIERVIIK